MISKGDYLYALLLCSTDHYDITMRNNVASDIHCNNIVGNDIAKESLCDVTMSNDIAMSISQCIMTLLCTSSITYYYALWYFWFISKLFKIVYINHY